RSAMRSHAPASPASPAASSVSFFFSSRRRHTRFSRDWSSDVCSSDLDLFLDAFRYQAGATAMSCVAAGLPVLGREGHGTLARLGTGINRFLGLDELVCADTAQYIDRAAALANEPARLAALRTRMREAASASGLFDPRRAAAAIEAVIDGLPGMRASTPMATDR